MITKSQTRASKTLKIVLIAALVICALIAGGLFVWSRTANQNNTTDQGQSGNATQLQVVVLDDLTYPKLPGWSGLKQEVLDSNGAVSGVGRSEPNGLFMLKTAASIPANNTELENGVLTELRKLSDFTLAESSDVTISTASGKKFIYTFTDAGSKIKQEMNVVVHKQKTYFFLFSGHESDSDRLKTDFANILIGTRFKD